MDFSTIEITSKKSTWKQRGFFNQRNYAKKVRGNEVDFSISEITSKKYMEMTWKFVETRSSTYGGNIDVKSMWIRRGVPVGYTRYLESKI